MSNQVIAFLEELLPARQILADLGSVLQECNYSIEMESAEVMISKETRLQIIGRSLHLRDPEVGFGNHCRVTVAIGGIRSHECGILEAEIGFALLWYSLERELITTDFSVRLP